MVFDDTGKYITVWAAKLEHDVLANAVKTLLPLKHVYRVIFPGKKRPYFPILEDNQGAVPTLANQCVQL